jgi:hypothetical protein
MWGLPLPRARPVLYVRGAALGLPKVADEEITDALIEKWHSKYIAEVERLYMTYRVHNSDYAQKPLEIH